MKADRPGEDGLADPFRGLRVERVRKPDGRWLLYYTFEEARGETGQSEGAVGRPAPTVAEPWTPESGPPADVPAPGPSGTG